MALLLEKPRENTQSLLQDKALPSMASRRQEKYAKIMYAIFYLCLDSVYKIYYIIYILDEQTINYTRKENTMNTPGKSYRIGAGWARHDRTPSGDVEIISCLSSQDVSPVHKKSEGYIAECSCCFLSFGHTVLLHKSYIK
jgi:hypothetical protein